MSAYIEFQNVKKIYQMGEVQIAAADGISFTAEQGEFVVYMQPKVDIQQGDAIGGAEAVNKSWPDFFETVRALGGKVELTDE